MSATEIIGKTAAVIEAVGEKKFCEELDLIMIRTGRGLAASKEESMAVLTKIVLEALSMTRFNHRGKLHNENDRLAQSLLVYYAKIKYKWSHNRICEYFGKKSKSFVNDCMAQVTETKRSGDFDRAQQIKTIELKLKKITPPPPTNG